METLSIESPKPFSLERIQGILAHCWRVDSSVANTLIVHGSNNRAYLHPDTLPTDIGIYRLLLDYSDVELAKGLVEKIADDATLTVDNDFGTVLPGNEFVARIRSETQWDWRYDS